MIFWERAQPGDILHRDKSLIHDSNTPLARPTLTQTFWWLAAAVAQPHLLPVDEDSCAMPASLIMSRDPSGYCQWVNHSAIQFEQSRETTGEGATQNAE